MWSLVRLHWKQLKKKCTVYSLIECGLWCVCLQTNTANINGKQKGILHYSYQIRLLPNLSPGTRLARLPDQYGLAFGYFSRSLYAGSCFAFGFFWLDRKKMSAMFLLLFLPLSLPCFYFFQVSFHIECGLWCGCNQPGSLAACQARCALRLKARLAWGLVAWLAWQIKQPKPSRPATFFPPCLVFSVVRMRSLVRLHLKTAKEENALSFPSSNAVFRAFAIVHTVHTVHTYIKYI